MQKPEDPKYMQAQKDGKAPLEYLVTTVWPGDAAVHKLGADKYGYRNWRRSEIRASTYVGAILRHLKAWSEGEDIDPESGYSHLYHIRACAAIVLDSEMAGTLKDDRLYVGVKDKPVQSAGIATGGATDDCEQCRAYRTMVEDMVKETGRHLREDHANGQT